MRKFFRKCKGSLPGIVLGSLSRRPGLEKRGGVTVGVIYVGGGKRDEVVGKKVGFLGGHALPPCAMTFAKVSVLEG